MFILRLKLYHRHYRLNTYYIGHFSIHGLNIVTLKNYSVLVCGCILFKHLNFNLFFSATAKINVSKIMSAYFINSTM